MRTTHRLCYLFATTFVLLTAAGQAQAGIKCWKNHEGVRECGNTVPPEFAQKGHETVSKQGFTKERVGAAKTIEALEKERAAAKLQAEAERKAAKETAEREAADRVLLDTFASVDDIVMTRDGQIAHLDSQIRLVESHIEKLQANLNQMIERAADVERKGKKPSEEMVANIANVRGQIAENEEFIANKHAEQDEIRARFDNDIERFQALKGID